MKRAHTALTWFFWFAFAAFMAASIPHVAYFFRAYEPVDAGLDVWYWTISTAIAVSIDITIFLLSLTVASLMRQHKPASLVFSVWLFVIGLSLLSWYMNYKYAEHFQNTSMISASPVILDLWVIHIQTADINPVLASMFQALSIAYTWISDKITADEKPKTAGELQAEADELERVTKQKQRIDSIKRGSTIGTFKGFIDATKEIKNHVFDQQSIDLENATTGDTSGDESIVEGDISDIQPIVEGYSNEYSPTSEQSTGRYVTLDGAASLLSCDVAIIKSLVTKGILKRAPRSDKSVSRASVNALLQRRSSNKKAVNTTRDTSEHAAIIPDTEPVSTSNGHSDGNAGDTDPLMLPALTGE